jgi:hypothetical protein
MHIEFLQQPERKRGGFSRAGLALGDHILARQNGRQTPRLYRRHPGITQGHQVIQQIGVQVQ